MERAICIHGHFYQPPRENPWLEAVEWQESAHPYHDWNERITAECYAPNAASRVLDEKGRIVEIINNYSRISFNFGPTLLSWLEARSLEVYQAILEADRQSLERFSGHGSALAQPYNHMILPLANHRDRLTQVRWGLRDFRHRFGRDPEGMWLPETAVDTETLEILSEHGIRFTVLAPHQARRVRGPRARTWREVEGERIDPTMAYSLQLPSGQKISLFFYDGPISRAVAFERLLTRGEDLAHRLTGAFLDSRTWPQMVHIAADGETYGHHHRFGDMALAYALRMIESTGAARITLYGEFLEQNPPTHQVEITEKTSWSCVHGVDRWWSNCGCVSGGQPGWNQAWRTPLRNALDWLRDEVTPRYEQRAREFLKDPWAARDDYIRVILDRSTASVDRFLAQQGTGPLDPPQRITALKLLELQRHAQLMYTSCGWFFNDLSGIETVQVIQYAGRVIQLAGELFQADFEPRFLQILEQAKSNLPDQGDGRAIYQRYVKPAMVDLERVGGHYAVSSLFEPYQERQRIYCYATERQEVQVKEAGRSKLVAGKIRLASEITQESALLTFGVLHMGEHHVHGGIRPFQGEEGFQRMLGQVGEAFEKADLAEVVRLLDRHFGESTYSLRSIFRDEQRKVVGYILQSTLEKIEAVYKQIYQDHAPLIRFLWGLRIAPPRALTAAAEFVLNSRLRRSFEAEAVDFRRIQGLLEEARDLGIALDRETLEFSLRCKIEETAMGLSKEPADLQRLEALSRWGELVRALPFEVNLWKVQNLCFEIRQAVYPGMRARADQADAQARDWTQRFVRLSDRLSVTIE